MPKSTGRKKRPGSNAQDRYKNTRGVSPRVRVLLWEVCYFTMGSSAVIQALMPPAMLRTLV